MYGSSGCGAAAIGVSSTKKHRPVTAGYLARPKLGALRGLYSTGKYLRPTTSAGYGFEKRRKPRKSTEPKMDFRKRPDYADTAYREAVSRLRIFLAESYTPTKRPIRELDSAGEETDNQSLLSGASRTSRPSHLHYRYSPGLLRRYPYYTPTRSALTTSHLEADKSDGGTAQGPPELMSFIERQEDYIEQLEKESKFCRGELASLLRKVKDVISENEDLHDKQKSTLIKSVFNRLETETETETEPESKRTSLFKSPKRTRRHVALEGPTIVFESRISELEAQLTQTKIDLRKAIDENESFKRKISDGSLSDGICVDTHRKQIDSLQREKTVLQETVAKLQGALIQLRDKENSSCDQVKRSLDAAEQAQYEKNAAEHEIRRLKDELERQHSKLRDTIGDQSRRIADERNAMERRYSQQIEQLTTELGVQWEATGKVQLELDKQRRENADLRRELAQKQAHVDELKKEMQNKISSMQSDIGVSGAEKSALEQQISTLQLLNERNDRQGRQESARLQAELQSLRQRLDRADADLIHSRRENIRLSEQIASLEKEINLNVALSDERSKRGGEVVALPPPAPAKDDREKELSSIVRDMESKHAATVAELEGMIHSQNQLMDKLTGECHALTMKLEDASTRHKEEIRELQANLEYLSSRVNHTQSNNKLPTQYKDEEYNIASTQRTAPQPHPATAPSPAAAPYPATPPSKPATGYSSRSPSNKNLSRASSSASMKPTTPPRRKSSVSQGQLPTAVGRQPAYAADEQPAYGNDEPYSTTTREQVREDQDQYSADPNQQYSTYATDQDYAADQQYDPNMQQYDQQYAYDPNADYSQYMTDPNMQQYSTDPNMDYAADPNAAYSTDPNAAYSTDPAYQKGYDPGQYEEQQPQPQPEPRGDALPSKTIEAHNPKQPNK